MLSGRKTTLFCLSPKSVAVLESFIFEVEAGTATNQYVVREYFANKSVPLGFHKLPE